jgi:internalin A
MSKITELWQEIRNWFSENCPDAPDTFMPGATVEEVDELKAYFSDTPIELIEILCINNGERFKSRVHPILGFELLEIKQIISLMRGWKGIANDMDEDGNNEIEGEVYPSHMAKRDYINRKYLIFAQEYRGSHLVIDLDPDTEGKYGQITHIGAEDKNRYVIADNLANFPSFVAYLNKEENMKIFPDESGMMRPIWQSNEGRNVSSMLDLLPALYIKGKIPYENPRP